MPDEFERHGRSSELDWGPSPSRSVARRLAAQFGADGGRKPKNTRTPKKQCTASPDGLHRGEPRIKRVYRKKDEPEPILICRWKAYWYLPSAGKKLAWWDCCHNEYCKHCGGKMADTMSTRCPDYPGSAEQRARAEQHTLELDRERRARGRSARQIRKTPDGPQGYRKPKAS